MKEQTPRSTLIKERDAFRDAAYREHELMRTWQARALAAEKQLNALTEKEATP